MIEDVENVRSDNGSDSGGSVGESIGSDGSGSGGSGDGSGGSDNGSGGSDNGSGGSDSGTGTGSGSGSANFSNTESSNGIIDGNFNAARISRADRIRARRSVRLGSADRDSIAGASTGSGSGTGDESEIVDREPVIRLGAKKQGKPRVEVKAENTTELKLSEMKDLISMFLDSIFEIPAALLKQDFWKLSKDENKMLTDAVSAYIKSMPKDKSSWLMSFIQDNLPLVNLLMIGFFIVSDRVKSSIAISQVTRHAKHYAETISANVSTNNGKVRTAMDDMFSN